MSIFVIFVIYIIIGIFFTVAICEGQGRGLPPKIIFGTLLIYPLIIFVGVFRLIVIAPSSIKEAYNTFIRQKNG